MFKQSTIALAMVSLSFAANAQGNHPHELFEQERLSIANAVEVYFPSKQLADKAAVSFHNELLESHKDKGFMVMSLSDKQKAKLKIHGFTFKPATNWIAARNAQITALQKKARNAGNKQNNETILGYSCYSTVEGTFNQAQSLADEYSQLAKWVDIGDSWHKSTDNGGYDIRVLQMTNSATAGEKPILFVHSAMHAREYATAELTLRFAKHLLQNYGQNADATWILDNHQVHVLFHLNPDGRKQAETGLLWRKNTNESYCGVDSNSRGVDLNRNFSAFWNAANGSSGNECSDTYRGPEPASEPETQAIEAYVRSIFEDRRGPGANDAAPLDTTGMHIDVHSYSQLVLWPWGHTYSPAPNATELTTLGRKLAFFNDYTPMQSVGLYPTDGTSDDVSYGELGVPAFTFELGTRFFQDCTTFNNRILPDNLKALMYAAKVVRAPYMLPAGPDAVDVHLNGQNTLRVSADSEVNLTTTLNDGRYQNGNGTEASQHIAQAEYYFNQTPWSDGATALAMNLVDGALDSSEEAFSAQINTTDLAEGNYLVYVRGKDADGNWGAVTAANLIIGDFNQAPVASFTADCNGLRCSFDGSGSHDSDGTLVNYQWMIADDLVGEGEDGAVFDHHFSDSGEYLVKLTVTDSSGATAEFEKALSITNLAPTAQFSVSCSNNQCTFNGTNSLDEDGTIEAYQWDLGDGNTAQGQSVAHTYSSAGSYEVSLTVIDNLAQTGNKTRQVTITMPPSNNTGTNTSSSSSGGGSFGLASLLLLAGVGRRYLDARGINPRPTS